MARELIVDIDESARRLAYTVVQGPMPLAHHHATMQVLPEGANHSRLVWTTDVMPNSIAAEVRARIEVGANVMRETIEREAGEGGASLSRL